MTEKGYAHNPATGRLDLGHPDIHHDLQSPGSPRSAVGLIVAALQARRATGTAPFTVLCCDNLPHNGRLLAGLARDFAAVLADDGLAAWIEADVAFPCTMVDRIVPAMTADDVADAAASLGLYDAAPISHEPFRQWVIEDRFGDAGRPAWRRLARDVVQRRALRAHEAAAVERRPLRAGLSGLPGRARDDRGRRGGPGVPPIRAGALGEIVPVVPVPPGVDLHGYAAELLARFSNTAIGTARGRSRWTARKNCRSACCPRCASGSPLGCPIRCLALAVAGWIRYVGGTDESGRPIDVRDPLARQLPEALEQAGPEQADPGGGGARYRCSFRQRSSAVACFSLLT